MEIDGNEAEVVADAVGEAAAAVVENAIDTANDDLQRAEATAAALAEGALESERGRRIEALEREISECRIAISRVEEGLQSLSSLREQMAEMNGALAALVMSQPSPSSSIQTEPLETPPLEPEAVEIGDPADAPPVVEEVPVEVPKRKRARWI